MKVSGTVVVVVGDGNGIGRQVVLELLRRGARVAAVDRRKDSLDETVDVAAARDRLARFPLDITDRDAVQALPEQVVDVRLYGTLHTVRMFLAHLLQRPVAHVANVSSMGGLLPVVTTYTLP